MYHTEFRQRLKPSLTTDDCNGYLQAPWHCLPNNHKLQKHKTRVHLSPMSEGQLGVGWHRLGPAEQLSSSWERRAYWVSSQARMPRGTGWDTRASKCRLEPEPPRLPHIWTPSRGVRRHGILPVRGEESAQPYDKPRAGEGSEDKGRTTTVTPTHTRKSESKGEISVHVSILPYKCNALTQLLEPTYLI